MIGGAQNFHVLQDGNHVLLLINGALVQIMPWQRALECAAALQSVARKAEEWDKAEAIAMDQAILMRSGAPFGLTDHPRIQQEAIKLAGHDRDLRRYLPSGIKSKSVVGTPTVSHIKPGAKNHD